MKVHDRLHPDNRAFPWGYDGMPEENGAVTVGHLGPKFKSAQG